MHDDGIVSLRSKNGALVFDTFIYIRSGAEGIVQSQLPLVVAHLVVPQFQLHAAQGQEPHAVGTLEEVFVDDGVGCLFLAGKDRVAHFLEMGLGLWAIVIVG